MSTKEMKKVLMVLVLLFVAVPAFGAFIEIPPKDPQCARGEKAICGQSCTSTLVYCGPSGTWEDGKFIQTPTGRGDCNVTSCSWNCFCVGGGVSHD